MAIDDARSVGVAVRPRATWPLRRQGLGAAAVFATCLGGLGIATFGVAAVGRYDAKTLLAFMTLQHPRLLMPARTVVNLVTPTNVIVATLVCVCCAAWQRGRRSVIAVLIGIGGANGTAFLLKAIMPAHGTALRGITSLAGGSFPSGHATAAMSIVLASLAALTGRSRRVIAVLGSCYVIVGGYAMLALGIHYPSDVIGGYLVAGLWAAFGTGLAIRGDRSSDLARRNAQGRSSLGPSIAWVSCAGATLIALAISLTTGPTSPVAVAIGAAAVETAALLTVAEVGRITCPG